MHVSQKNFNVYRQQEYLLVKENVSNSIEFRVYVCTLNSMVMVWIYWDSPIQNKIHRKCLDRMRIS